LGNQSASPPTVAASKPISTNLQKSPSIIPLKKRISITTNPAIETINEFLPTLFFFHILQTNSEKKLFFN